MGYKRSSGTADNKRDWVEILLAPLLIGVIGVALTAWFSWQQDQRQTDIESRRAQSERTIEEQRAQDAALQAYLDQMSTLLLEKDIRTSPQESEVRILARARTLTVLERLDPSRKTQVMQFLYEANLIGSEDDDDEKDPIIGLSSANLSGADLTNADLVGTDLSQADLSGADLHIADLYKANLYEANLSGADLSDSDPREADLTFANLSNANLNDATMSNATLSAADLSGADLSEADLLEANLSSAFLNHADLREAYLNHADLTEADLSDANLTEASLIEADLTEADLTEADLTEAKGITNEELYWQADSLEGATMPNGQKYEDWYEDWR